MTFDKNMFNKGNLHLVDNPASLVVDAVAVLIGDYEIHRKKAAILILKIFLNDEFRKFLFEDENIYPISRNDSRVLKWKKIILAVGKCQLCGSEESLEAHHILHWADYPLGRIDVKNGECLCHQCHAIQHFGEPVFELMMSK